MQRHYYSIFAHALSARILHTCMSHAACRTYAFMSLHHAFAFACGCRSTKFLKYSLCLLRFAVHAPLKARLCHAGAVLSFSATAVPVICMRAYFSFCPHSFRICQISKDSAVASRASANAICSAFNAECGRQYLHSAAREHAHSKLSVRRGAAHNHRDTLSGGRRGDSSSNLCCTVNFANL